MVWMWPLDVISVSTVTPDWAIMLDSTNTLRSSPKRHILFRMSMGESHTLQAMGRVRANTNCEYSSRFLFPFFLHLSAFLSSTLSYTNPSFWLIPKTHLLAMPFQSPPQPKRWRHILLESPTPSQMPPPRTFRQLDVERIKAPDIDVVGLLRGELDGQKGTFGLESVRRSLVDGAGCGVSMQ